MLVRHAREFRARAFSFEPRLKQPDVPSYLRDRVLRTAVALKLHHVTLKRLFDPHGLPPDARGCALGSVSAPIPESARGDREVRVRPQR